MCLEVIRFPLTLLLLLFYLNKIGSLFNFPIGKYKFLLCNNRVVHAKRFDARINPFIRQGLRSYVAMVVVARSERFKELPTGFSSMRWYYVFDSFLSHIFNPYMNNSFENLLVFS